MTLAIKHSSNVRSDPPGEAAGSSATQLPTKGMSLVLSPHECFREEENAQCAANVNASPHMSVPGDENSTAWPPMDELRVSN